MPVKVTYPNLPDDFRELVKEARIAKGLSMRRMAAALGVKPATVSQLERGDRNFSYYRAIQFRDYLDLDYDLPTPAPDASQKVTRNRKKITIELLDKQAKEMFDYIDQLIVELQVRRKELRREMIKAQRWALDELMVELLSIIRDNPGINRTKISKLMKLNTELTYNNTMTSLRRRNLIINKGTRSDPHWYCVKEHNVS